MACFQARSHQTSRKTSWKRLSVNTSACACLLKSEYLTAKNVPDRKINVTDEIDFMILESRRVANAISMLVSLWACRFSARFGSLDTCVLPIVSSQLCPQAQSYTFGSSPRTLHLGSAVSVVCYDQALMLSSHGPAWHSAKFSYHYGRSTPFCSPPGQVSRYPMKLPVEHLQISLCDLKCWPIVCFNEAGSPVNRLGLTKHFVCQSAVADVPKTPTRRKT